jgi:hypothetical protein
LNIENEMKRIDRELSCNTLIVCNIDLSSFVFRVKDILGTYSLETLFFGISVSIRIADGFWVLGC